MSQKIDVDQYRASITRLNDIFRDMSDTVTVVSTWRCPYKNVENMCTARFGCRNQSLTGVPGELPKCLGSDELDYRSACEV